FDRITLPQLVLLLLFLVVPATLFGGHILPRWLTVPRAGLVVQALRRPLSMSRSMLSLVLPGGAHETSEDLQALAREGNASGLVAGDELMMVGGVMTFAERPVHEVMTPRTDVVAISSEDGY